MHKLAFVIGPPLIFICYLCWISVKVSYLELYLLSSLVYSSIMFAYKLIPLKTIPAFITNKGERCHISRAFLFWFSFYMNPRIARMFR